MRFAIIGAGVIGAVHARLLDSLPERATLVAVVDIDVERAHNLADPRGARVYSDTASLYAAEEVDAVSICLSSALHSDFAIEALSAGKHVLVEKPIDISLAAADRLIAAEAASGKVVTVVSQRRFQAASSFVKRSIEQGELGRITSGAVESPFFRPQAYYDSGDWRGTLAGDGGGALMNQGIHALDLLVWALGEPVRVSAFTGQVAHERIEVEDIAAAVIEFEGGAIGTIVASTAAYPGLPVRLSVHGDEGSAVIEQDELRYFHSRSHEQADHQSAAGLLVEELPEGWSSVDWAHRAQYEDFIDAIEAGRSPAVTTRDGRRSLAVVLAVYESAKTGRSVELTQAALS